MQSSHQQRQEDPVDECYADLVAAAEQCLERLREVRRNDADELRASLQRVLPSLRRAAGLPPQPHAPERPRRQLSLLVQPLQ